MCFWIQLKFRNFMYKCNNVVSPKLNHSNTIEHFLSSPNSIPPRMPFTRLSTKKTVFLFLIFSNNINFFDYCSPSRYNTNCRRKKLTVLSILLLSLNPSFQRKKANHKLKFIAPNVLNYSSKGFQWKCKSKT